MTPPPFLFHSLLRPAVLQILRATGYHGAKTSVLDSMTDLAARYLFHLCKLTAVYAGENESQDMTPTIVDVRMALQHAGALLPEKPEEEQEYLGIEDTRGLDDFLAWATGPMNKEIKRIALDGSDEADDYLDALKKKHSKNDDDSKYVGTLLGKSNEHGDVLVEGGEYPSIMTWEERMREAAERTPDDEDGMDYRGMNGDKEDSRPPSSGLSSLGDRSIADEMDLS
ncbi:hypothetical protein B0T19DRAFT_44625 [Cercophora scortea]|uniref:Bromodomain associated domain-containing protein n=1 Tax=Cercophora scortea TaxID=314031 RepID=A0AAE0J4Y5_9PEZI|nr:hypothetical protein B0T19DRAFT_44625 [Cercophora scortea]